MLNESQSARSHIHGTQLQSCYFGNQLSPFINVAAADGLVTILAIIVMCLLVSYTLRGL